MTEPFFHVEPDGTFLGTDQARGPWDAAACHGGPPTALLARASELAAPTQRLARLTVDLLRPVPLAGFTIDTEVLRAGRTTTGTTLELRDRNGRLCARATALHVGERPTIDHVLGNDFDTPSFAHSVPGPFPISRISHGLPSFRDAVELRYPPTAALGPGPTTVWMRSAPLLDGETMSPFQRVCPLADCGNAFSRHAESTEVTFINADLTISLHRDPVGEWIGMAATSVWQPGGIGLSDSVLFDEHGVVGRTNQTMVLVAQPAPGMP